MAYPFFRRQAAGLAVIAALAGPAHADVVPGTVTVRRPGPRPRVMPPITWRGPDERGTSDRGPLKLDKPLWTLDVAGRGAPVVDAERVYVVGWRGDGPDLQEVLVAVERATGRVLWEHGENDFLSDTVYNRYGIGAATVDRETHNVYAMTANGVFSAFDRDGKLLWQHSMMEEYGRLTFPNSRTGAPVIDDDLVIVRGITSNWGAQGAPRDRFYAFDKRTGAAVWSSTPGEAPKDNSFSTPIFGWQDGKRVFYVGTGCGNVVCVNARTGQPVWRYPVSSGGVNATVVLDGKSLFAVHGVENLDSSTAGRLYSIDVEAAWKQAAGKKVGPGEPVVVDKSVERWRADLSSFSSSPAGVGHDLVLTTDTGELVGVDGTKGTISWRLKLARDQIHASPIVAGGYAYVPMNDGSFHVVKLPGKGGKPEVVAKAQLEGNCLGAPAIVDGMVIVSTTAKVYAFGQAGAIVVEPKGDPDEWRKAGAATQLQARPSEIVLRPGESARVAVRRLDGSGFDAGEAEAVAWQKFVPATAKVKSFLDAEFDSQGNLVAPQSAKPSAGAFEATAGGLKGTIRGRLVPGLPMAEDFESFTLAEEGPDKVKFAYPPLPWIGGRFAWEVREVAGTRALSKVLDTLIRQRAQTFIGHPDMRDYTVTADVMSDGNRRLMSDVGVINQRYLISLKGTWQQLEVSSNFERIRVAVPFKWQPGKWYRVMARVDVDGNGRAVVRAKAWPRDEAEPAAWTIEVPHAHGHTHGSPGIYGFAPDARFRVYVDNVRVSPSAAAAASK